MILILGDVHLGSGKNLSKSATGVSLHSRVLDQIDLLDWVLNEAIDNICQHIVITGDIFEEPKPESSLIKLFITWLKKCEINNINVHVIVGNHDILRSGQNYSSPLDIITAAEMPMAFVYNAMNSIHIDNTSITFLPFRDRKSYLEASNSEALKKLQNELIYEKESLPLNNKKIIIGHLAIEGSFYVGDEIDDLSNELFCPLDMFEGYDYVWMGHVHSPQVMKKQNPYIAHIGSMDLSNFGECDHKKHIIVFDTENGTFVSKNLPTRELKKISIAIPADIEDATAYAIKEIQKSSFNKSIVKVDITTEAGSIKPVNKTFLEQKLKELGCYTISAISETKKQSIVNKQIEKSIDGNITVKSAIKKYADSFTDENLKNRYIEKAIEIFEMLQEK